MRRSRAVCGAAALAAVLASVTWTAVPASAHTHPTPVERDSPGVVFVETRAHVEISLIEPDSEVPGRVALTQKTYEPVLSSGSGFAVDPSGYIVTSDEVISPDRRPAEIFAVNQLFSDRYGSAAPLPENPFVERRLAAGGQLDRRLQRCYRPNTTDVSGGCVVRTTLRVAVYPYVTDQEHYGTLAARVLSRDLEDSPVAVLKVGANSMPTVELADSVGEAEALAVLGFRGVPGDSNQLVKVDAHLNRRVGTPKAEDLGTLLPALTDGLRGGPVVAEKGQVVGFFPRSVAAPGQPAGSATNPERPVLVDAETVQAALAIVGVTPRRGPTDLAFEDALHSFKNDEFAGSIPSLQSTLRSYPGHFIAAANLEVAQARRGTNADLTGQGATGAADAAAGDDSNLTWVAALIAGVAVVAALGLLLLRRRRAPAATGKPSPAAVPAPSTPHAAGRGSPGAPAGGAAAHVGPPGRPAAPAPRAPRDAARVPTGGQPGIAAARPVRQEPAPAGMSVASTGAAATSQSRRAAASSAGEAHTYCTSCGQRLAPNHRFCGWCGHQIQ